MTSSQHERACDKISQLSEKLATCSDKLRNMIDINHGLLRELLSLCVLSRDQIEDVRRKPLESSEVSQLLDYVIKSSCDQQKRFLVALYKTGQQHVNNYILAN
jgi:hypothetical protein